MTRPWLLGTLLLCCGCGRTIGLLPPSTLKTGDRELIVAAAAAYSHRPDDPNPSDDSSAIDADFLRAAAYAVGRYGATDHIELHAGVSVLSLGLVGMRLGVRIAALGAAGAQGLGIILGAETEVAALGDPGRAAEVHLPLQIGYTAGQTASWVTPRVTKALGTDLWLGGGSIGLRYRVVTFELGVQTALRNEERRLTLGEFGIGYAW